MLGYLAASECRKTQATLTNRAILAFKACNPNLDNHVLLNHDNVANYNTYKYCIETVKNKYARTLSLWRQRSYYFDDNVQR